MSREKKSQTVTRRRDHTHGTMSVDDDVGPSPGAGEGEVYLAERVLNTGDFYTGQWVGDVPHGYGKYLWTDGCMYVGEWRKGTTMGKGKFCWPSGATYEGDFRDGNMEGKGTYMGPSGDTYRGQWSKNLKHGKGTKNYPNGDYYDGEWQLGVQHGHGRYQWKNGNHYIGEWTHGTINGNGTMVWSNGNRYTGFWEDGLPKGDGTFQWADGSFYVGVWGRGEQQSGTYYPSGLTGGIGFDNLDSQKLFAFDLSDMKISNGEKVALSVLPSQKKLLRGSDIGKLRRMSADNGRVYNYNWDSDGNSDSQNGNGDDEEYLRSLEDLGLRSVSTPRQQQQQQLRIQQLVKRPGETISKGHKNYDLMLNLQLGIRHSVARPAPATSFDLKASAFDPKEKIWTKFPTEGSKHTPPHQTSEFKWKDYCPVVFRTLRKLFKVDAADYMISLCGNEALRELSSPGKSGSFFYLTNDDKYMIKTLKKAEVKMLLKMLPAYYNHVRAFENTLVTKFFGLHCVKLTGSQKKVRFVIMGNLFCSDYTIHRRFDLKGSSQGRTTSKPDAEVDTGTTLKDLDLNFVFRLQKTWFQEFSRQVERDCEFLEQEKIMDYSLLVGVHFRQVSNSRDCLVPEPCTPPSQTPSGNGGDNAGFEAAGSYNSSITMDRHLLDPARWASIKLGINMPARAERTIRRTDFDPNPVGEPTGEMYDVIMYFGIIDILQDYDITKKLEHVYKAIQYDGSSISAVDPKQYARRFREFIFKAFIDDN